MINETHLKIGEKNALKTFPQIIHCFDEFLLQNGGKRRDIKVLRLLSLLKFEI